MNISKLIADNAETYETYTRPVEVIYEFDLKTNKVYKHWDRAVVDYYDSRPCSSVNNIPCARFGNSILIKEYVYEWILTNLKRKLPANYGF